MKIDFVLGRSGVGKTNYILEQLIKTHQTGQSCILIVPDQATFEAEQTLMRALGGGLLGVEVLGFTRLANRILSVAGGKTRLFLNDDGKKMVLRNILQQEQKRLKLYGEKGVKSGFVQKLNELIKVLKYSDVSGEELMIASENVQEELLKQKLFDLSVLFSALQSFMKDQYIDAEDAQQLLIDRLPQAAFIRESAIFIDGIAAHLFSKRTHEVISNLMQYAKSTMISLRICDPEDADAALFAQGLRVFALLHERAQEIKTDSATVQIKRLTKAEGYASSFPKAVQVLEQHLYTYEDIQCSSEGLCLFEAQNQNEEVHAAAQYIDQLLREGARCGEIAIALGDEETYSSLLRRQLSNLPMFLDQKRPLAHHGPVKLCMAALDTILHRFRVLDVMRVVKSGFSGLTAPQAEAFENYVLQFGINFNAFCKPFEKMRHYYDHPHAQKKKEEQLELLQQAEEARNIVITPLLNLQEALKNANHSSEYCSVMFDYFTQIGLRERLDENCEFWQQSQQWDIAFELAQVWNAMMSLFDQAATLLGEQMTLETFAKVLEEGFDAHEIGMVPAQVDQITVGNVEKLALHTCKHLLVLGCNEGQIPQTPTEAGLLDDADVQSLEQTGLNAVTDSNFAALSARHSVYALFSRAQKSLYVSWAKGSNQGETLYASGVIDRLNGLFPDAKRFTLCHDLSCATNPQSAFVQTVSAIQEYYENDEKTRGLEDAIAYFREQANYAHEINAIRKRFVQDEGQMHSDGAAKLYTRSRSTSVSQIETFNDCPFKHFVKYGLRPNVFRKFGEDALEQGNFYHEALDEFTRTVIGQKLSWQALDENTCELLLEPIVENLQSKHNLGALLTTASNQAIARRMERTLKTSCMAMVKQIQKGKFVPTYSELSFGEKEFAPLQLTLRDGSTISLMGKVDRLDVFEDSHLRYLRIVDYKTGGDEFRFSDLLHGVKLQLPLYCSALKELGQSSGMFYLHICDVISDEEKLSQSQNPDDILMQPYQLKGILIQERDVIQAMDQTESDLVIPQALKKDGSFKQNDMFIPMEQWNILLEYAQEKAIESLEEIAAGKTQADPIEKGNNMSSCSWCDYAAICRKEAARTGSFRNLKKLKAKQFFEQAEKKAAPKQKKDNKESEEES